MSTVCDFVTQATRAAPEAIALESKSARMTYSELDARANGLAAQLKFDGVATQSVVGVCLPRSPAQIIACLAAMKAGAAYLPLDPAWPKDRTRFVLRDADCSLVVANRATDADLSTAGCTLVDLDEAGLATSKHSSGLKQIDRSPEDLAYIIYTSGSSGEPKGVELTHGNLGNLIDWHRRNFGLTPADRVSHCAGLSFDAAVWEVWATLSAGATLVLPDEEVRTSSMLLHDWLIERKLTVAFVPTVLAEPLMKADWPSDTRLRLLLTGAETLHSFPRTGLPFSVVNNYGPTECAVVATSGLVPVEGAETTDLPTIGRPISNVEIYILDEKGEPVPDGESGEICIGGAGVGRGYRNRPDLTAKRFLPDRFANSKTARMYRTGDIGRMLPDGEIVFEGRLDNQEKIRGYRVELDGIASQLSRHPAVASSVVIADGAAGDKRLVAYFVPADSRMVTAHDLREFLSRSVPDHMIPSIFIKLDALPLTSQGKLDRNALPKPTSERALGDVPYRAPATPTERRIAAIVANVLGARQIGAEDNFFLLGGHSLLGTQVVLQARQAFGIDLTLRHLFNAPTVASLAQTVERLAVQKVQSMTDEEVRSETERISVTV